MDERLQRIEKILAMILLHDLKDAPQGEKAMVLSKAGFGNSEIADFLGTTAGVVNQQLYAMRIAKAGKARGTKSTKKKKR